MSTDTYWLMQNMRCPDDPEASVKAKEIRARLKREEEDRARRKEQRRDETVAKMMRKYCPAIGGEKCRGESCICFNDNGASIMCRHYQTSDRYAD